MSALRKFMENRIMRVVSLYVLMKNVFENFCTAFVHVFMTQSLLTPIIIKTRQVNYADEDN